MLRAGPRRSRRSAADHAHRHGDERGAGHGVEPAFFLWMGLHDTQGQEAPRCDRVVMSPGDICHRPDGRVNTYEQEIAVTQTMGWMTAGMGILCGIVCLVVLTEWDKD